MFISFLSSLTFVRFWKLPSFIRNRLNLLSMCTLLLCIRFMNSTAGRLNSRTTSETNLNMGYIFIK